MGWQICTVYFVYKNQGLNNAPRECGCMFYAAHCSGASTVLAQRMHKQFFVELIPTQPLFGHILYIATSVHGIVHILLFSPSWVASAVD